RVVHRPAILVVLVPTCAGLLAVASNLAQAVFRKRLPDTRILRVLELFADAPADVESGQISGRERTHRHSEIVQRFIDSLDRRAFFNQELRLAPIRPEHAIADKSTAVSYQHAYLAELLRQCHAGSDYFFRAGLA